MVRAALKDKWRCLFANDFDHKKCATYELNWGESTLRNSDVRHLTSDEIPDHADLAWASFPCQDLSLAGGGAGLKGDRSGTFWPFWALMSDLALRKRAPRIIALENVCGTLTSHEGRDFSAICVAFRANGYRVGAMVIDAAHFLAQSRPRLFVIGIRDDLTIPALLHAECADDRWHPSGLRRAQAQLSLEDQNNWIWWTLPNPPRRRKSLVDSIDLGVEGHVWHTKAHTRELLAMMDKVNKEKLKQVQRSGKETLGTMYRRTRPDRRGGTVQRIEARFDGIAGCLRTPAGGSSRQLVIRICGEDIKTRLLTTREAANLMGLPKSYQLPHNYNEAYHLVGDGVAVPVVDFVASNLFTHLLNANRLSGKIAA